MFELLIRLQKRIYQDRYITFTPPGTRFVLLTLAVGIAALNTGNNLLYLIVGMMLSLIVVSGVLSEQSLKKINFEWKFPSRIFARKPFGVELRIQNLKKILPSFSFRVCGSSPKGWSTYIFKLIAGESTTERFETVFPDRGQVKVESLILKTTFPFGFFNKVMMRPQNHSVLVYPSILPVEIESGDRLQAQAASYSGRKKGQGVNLYGLREYTPQDDARRIHWKASARETRILLKEFERDENQDLLIFFSNHIAEMPAGENFAKADLAESASKNGERFKTFERAVKMAASLVVAHRENGHAVVLVTLGSGSPALTGNKTLYGLLGELALIQPVDRETALRSQPAWIKSAGAGGGRRVLILPASDPLWEKDQGVFSDVWVAEDSTWVGWEARGEKTT